MLTAPGTIIAFFLLLSLSACGGGSSPPDTKPATPTASPTIPVEPSPTDAPTQQPQPSGPPPALGTPEPTTAPLKPDTSADPALPKPSSENYAAATKAARFLTQASFGPTAKSIVELMGKSQEQWITEQIALPQTFHLPLLDERLEQIGLVPAPETEEDTESWLRDIQRSDIWWESAIWGEDQLRQKMAYALSQLLVISNVSDVLFNDSRGIANYHDILARHAFGNYRDLLEAVTLNPMMGEYLSMVRNEKANEQRNIRPDENYAREIMQLFSIGLVELNLDGTVKLDEQDQVIPSYGQDDIKNLARVFTGWNMATIDNWWEWTSTGDAEILPMKAFNAYHDTTQKILFGSKIIPPNQTPQQDLDSALDIIFAHPNVAPFISKQLIQRFVTSNPSPEYVSRVASVFNNNGEGVKGDLSAVIKAILLDDEALTGHTSAPTSFGKLREPILKIAAIWRAFKAQGVPVSNLDNENSPIFNNRLRFRGTDREFGQRPYGSFSVFNFYRPDFQQPGAIKDSGLSSPEFQIMTDSQMITANSYTSFNIFWRDTQNQWPKSELVGEGWDIYPSQLYLEQEKALTENPAELLDRINLLLTSGQMSKTMYELILDNISNYNSATGEMMIYEALLFVTASPEFAVQR